MRAGPADGPYRAAAKFDEIRRILVNKFGDTSTYETTRILQQAFPRSVKERTTFVYGVRLAHVDVIPTQRRPIPASVPQLDKDMGAENEQLKEKISKLEQELSALRQSSVSVTDIERQASQFSHVCASSSHSLEQLSSFSIKTLWNDAEKEAPDLLHLFQTLGDTSRNLHDDGNLAVEQVKGMVSLCTLLNSRCA